ncbi:hypothetical protein Tco_0161487 [Tanacetum coccineum]
MSDLSTDVSIIEARIDEHAAATYTQLPVATFNHYPYHHTHLHSRSNDAGAHLDIGLAGDSDEQMQLHNHIITSTISPRTIVPGLRCCLGREIVLTTLVPGYRDRGEFQLLVLQFIQGLLRGVDTLGWIVEAMIGDSTTTLEGVDQSVTRSLINYWDNKALRANQQALACFKQANEPLAIPLDEIQIDDKLNFIEEPVEIMDQEVKWLKQSRIPIVKVNKVRETRIHWWSPFWSHYYKDLDALHFGNICYVLKSLLFMDELFKLWLFNTRQPIFRCDPFWGCYNSDEINMDMPVGEKQEQSAKEREVDTSVEDNLARNLQAQLEAELIEEERLTRKQEEEANIALIESWDNTQAMMEADFELAQRLQIEEQGEITIEERSRLYIELMNKRKKHFAMLRAEEKRRKPPTKAQKRNLMSTYLKNMGGYKHNQLKSKSYEKIQNLFDNEMRRVNTFIPMDSEVVKIKKEIEESSKGTENELESDKSKKAESSEEKAKGSRKKILGKKRAGKEQQQESSRDREWKMIKRLMSMKKLKLMMKLS